MRGDGFETGQLVGWAAAGVALWLVTRPLPSAAALPPGEPSPLVLGAPGSTALTPAPAAGLVLVGTRDDGRPLYAAGTATAGAVTAAVVAAGGAPVAALTAPGLSSQQIANLVIGPVRTGASILDTLTGGGLTFAPDLGTLGEHGGVSLADVLRPIDTAPPDATALLGNPDQAADFLETAGATPDVTSAADAISAGEVEVETFSAPIDLADLGSVMQVLGVAALLVDIGFTIAGDAPNAVKAITTALDIGMIVCLYIPVYGWIAAIVLAVVKFVFKLFAGQLFGGLSHEEREALERARYARAVSPMLPEIAQCYAPRELVRTLWRWGSGACGGQGDVAMMIGLRGTSIIFGQPGPSCPYQVGTLDEQAEAFASGIGHDPNLYAAAQVGIRPDLRAVFESGVLEAIRARVGLYESMWAQGITLDQMDAIAAEYRRTDALQALATLYGWATWQAMFAALVGPAWAAYVEATPTGASINGLAQRYGFPDAIALRETAFAGYAAFAARVRALDTRVTVLEHFPGLQVREVLMPITPPTFPTYTPDQAVQTYLAGLERRVLELERALQLQQASGAIPSGGV